MFNAIIFAFAIGSTLCYIECFVTDLCKKNNFYGYTGRNFFFISIILWGAYHYLTH